MRSSRVDDRIVFFLTSKRRVNVFVFVSRCARCVEQESWSICTLFSEFGGTKLRKTLSDGTEHVASNDSGYQESSRGLKINYMYLSSGSMVIGRLGVS